MSRILSIDDTKGHTMSSSSKRTLIRGGVLIDGTGADPIEDGAILIENGKIVEVGPSSAIRSTGAEIIEAGGRTIMPGLIDAHIHIGSDGSPNVMRRLKDKHAYTAIKSAVHARKLLEAGFTTIRDAAAHGYTNIATRDAINEGLIPGPRMRAPGYGLTSTGGHGDSYYAPHVHVENPGLVDGPDEVRKATRLMLKMGADCIKFVSATGGVMSDGDEPGAPQFTVEEMAAGIHEAKANGVHTFAHAQGTQGIKNAIEAGITSIEHGFWIDDETAQMMIDNDVYFVPTLAAVHQIVEYGLEAGIPEYAVRKASEAQEAHLESFDRAYKAGVKIAMGTDAGTPFNRQGENAIELELMNRAGMSAMDAIVATTKTAAECIKFGDVTGTLEVGKAADVILVDGDPLAQVNVLRNVEKIHLIMKEGEVYANRMK
jgi:imidazolonepropionase-like amidohydrolase